MGGGADMDVDGGRKEVLVYWLDWLGVLYLHMHPDLPLICFWFWTGKTGSSASDQCHGPPRVPGAAWRRVYGRVHCAAMCTPSGTGGKGPLFHPSLWAQQWLRFLVSISLTSVRHWSLGGADLAAGGYVA